MLRRLVNRASVPHRSRALTQHLDRPPSPPPHPRSSRAVSRRLSQVWCRVHSQVLNPPASPMSIQLRSRVPSPLLRRPPSLLTRPVDSPALCLLSSQAVRQVRNPVRSPRDSRVSAPRANQAASPLSSPPVSPPLHHRKRFPKNGRFWSIIRRCLRHCRSSTAACGHVEVPKARFSALRHALSRTHSLENSQDSSSSPGTSSPR